MAVEQVNGPDLKRRRLQSAAINANNFMLAHGFEGEVDSE